MMQFMIHTQDREDGLSIRQANREAHLAWVKGGDARVDLLMAGPWLDEAGEMRGSLLIVEAEKKSDVEDWLAEDPYKKAGLPKTVSIRGFKWAINPPTG